VVIKKSLNYNDAEPEMNSEDKKSTKINLNESI